MRRRPVSGGATLLLTVALVLALAGVAGAVPGTKHHSSMPVLASWSTPHTDVSYASIACHEIGYCTAIGVHADSSGDFLPATDTEVDGYWQTPQTIALPDGAVPVSFGLGFRSIACPKQGACEAVGTYWDPATSHGFEPMIASQTNEVWGPATAAVPLPSGATMAELDAIWCGAVGTCVAVGSFWTSDDGDSKAFVDAESGGAWQPSVTLPTPRTGLSGPIEVSPSSISCTRVVDCAVVGEIASSMSTTTQLGLAEVERAGTWKAHLFYFSPSSGTDITLTSVACPTTSVCLAVGSGGTSAATAGPLAETLADGTWEAGKVLPYRYFAPATDSGVLEDVSCSSALRCLTVGELDPSSAGAGATAGQLPVAYTWDGGHWSSPALIATPSAGGAKAGGASLAAIACPTTRECEVVGTTAPATSSSLTKSAQPASSSATDAYPYSAVVVPFSSGADPGAPASLAVASQQGAFNVTWRGPSTYGGSPIQSFLVVAHSKHEPTVSCLTASLSCTLPGIAQSHRYVVDVTARNAALRTGPAAVVAATS